MNTYHATSSGMTREILRVVFFVTRAAPNAVIKEGIRARVHTIHTMLGLAKDKALIRQGH